MSIRNLAFVILNRSSPILSLPRRGLRRGSIRESEAGMRPRFARGWPGTDSAALLAIPTGSTGSARVDRRDRREAQEMLDPRGELDEREVLGPVIVHAEG